MNSSLILQFWIFAIVSCGLATQQVRHDRTFQPDHILRVSEQHKAIACRIKAIAVVNGMSTSWTLWNCPSMIDWLFYSKEQPPDRPYTYLRTKPPGWESTMTSRLIIWQWYELDVEKAEFLGNGNRTLIAISYSIGMDSANPCLRIRMVHRKPANGQSR